MEATTEFELNELGNLEKAIQKEFNRFEELRKMVKQLQFVPLDSIGNYGSITYKSVDGGKMGISFDPLDLDFVRISDSFGNDQMKFITPKGDELNRSDFVFLDDFPQVKSLLNLLKLQSVEKMSPFLDANIAMELCEYACIFNRIASDSDPVLIMKDGLLRTKAVYRNYIPNLIEVLKQNPKQKLVGVAKRSRLLSIISTALFIENKLPLGYTGYVEVPLEIENLAYKWTGSVIMKNQTSPQPLDYALGKLYIARLSRHTELLVTIEIPYDYKNKEPVYSSNEVHEIIGHLIRDSEASYPTIGYPQTIMKAHEKAVQHGFTASIWRDKIIEEFLKKLDPKLRDNFKVYELLRDAVDKGIMGGF